MDSTTFKKDSLSYPYLVVLLVVISDSLANTIFGIATQDMNAEAWVVLLMITSEMVVLGMMFCLHCSLKCTACYTQWEMVNDVEIKPRLRTSFHKMEYTLSCVFFALAGAKMGLLAARLAGVLSDRTHLDGDQLNNIFTSLVVILGDYVLICYFVGRRLFMGGIESANTKGIKKKFESKLLICLLVMADTLANIVTVPVFHRFVNWVAVAAYVLGCLSFTVLGAFVLVMLFFPEKNSIQKRRKEIIERIIAAIYLVLAFAECLTIMIEIVDCPECTSTRYNNLTTTLVVILLDTFLFLFFLVRSLLKGKRTRSILEKIKAVIGVAFRGDDDDVETDWIYSEGGGGAKNFNLDSYEAV